MQTLLFDLSQFTTVVINDNEVCKCADCDQDLDRDDCIEIDDSIYCDDCVSYCHHCDDAVLEDDLTTVYTREYSRGSREYCNRCIERETFTCDHCGDYHSDDLSEYHIQDTDTVICSGCYEHNDYFYCSDCEEYYSDRSANYSDDGTFCNDCIGDHIKNENIKDYGYDPLNDLDFLGDPKDDLYLGLELEVYVNKDLNDTANTVSDLLNGYAILKEDSSISMPGFEIVTAPCSLAIHREKITEFFSNNPDIDTDDSIDIGLHIHISRKPLTQLTIGKMLVFINNPDNQDKIVAIAGRSSNKWATISPKKITDIKKQTSRYEAINLQNNDTVEFRIFASTVDPKLILARLEFVHALTIWVKDQSMLSLGWNIFISYVRENKALYPNLVEWLDNNN
jgi:hypothetical protein